ncbi:MAG: hypothetical protein GYB65_13175 [Chloroflexi bacterium]|nr:hypothetical protein [Chloroflexota bacterium]
MSAQTLDHLPPLQGCLYCHAEGSTTLVESRKVLGIGSDYPVLKCSHCKAVALLDVGAGGEDSWRIRYRRVPHTPRYFYLARHLGKAGWLSAEKALAISTDGYVQRTRVQQARQGDLVWLQPVRLDPPPPLMRTDETVYLTLRAVSFQQAPPQTVFTRPEHGDVLDSGKLYVTNQKLHLLGQRQDWSHRLSDIQRVDYGNEYWIVFINAGSQMQKYRGMHMDGQLDPQLITTIIEALWRLSQMRSEPSTSFDVLPE